MKKIVRIITTCLAAVVALGLVSVPAEAAVKKPAKKPNVTRSITMSVLTFATFNVCKVNCAAPAPSWDIRRDRVARVINESGADVVGLQEATNWATNFSKTQVDDIVNLTAPAGYALVSVKNEMNECRRPRDTRGELAGPSPCDNTAALLYRTSTVEQAASPHGIPTAGIIQAGSIIPGLDAESAKRSIMWAYLQGKNGTSPFLAISLHTDNQKTPEVENSRILLGQSMSGWVLAMNNLHGFPNAPSVLLADLNSYDKRQPNGMQTMLKNNGWVDTHKTESRRNIQYSSINYNPLLGTEQGFPAKPYAFQKTRKNPNGEATRIDYILTYGGGLKTLDYEVVIRLDSNGMFIPEYQASDHQMVRAVIAFPNM